MARRRRQNLSQQVVGMASYGLPAPVRSVARSYWGSRIVVFLVCAALATGVLHISWKGGVPKLTVDQERAQELKAEIQRQKEQLVELRRQQGLRELLPDDMANRWSPQQNGGAGFVNPAQPTGQPTFLPPFSNVPNQPSPYAPQQPAPYGGTNFGGVPQQSLQPPQYFPR